VEECEMGFFGMPNHSAADTKSNWTVIEKAMIDEQPSIFSPQS
jgi:hypothetical protein